MITVFGDDRSGNCLKVKWLLDYLGLPYEWHQLNVLEGQSRTPEFLSMNPAGQVPVVQLADGRFLAQSNAIVLYFAEGTDLVPDDAFMRARMMEWLFWEQYSHEPYLAVRRFQRLYLGTPDEDIDPKLFNRGAAALTRMEQALAAGAWLIGDRVSAADLCLLPYTLLAPEGGFDLDHYPRVRRWTDRAMAAFDIGRTDRA